MLGAVDHDLGTMLRLSAHRHDICGRSTQLIPLSPSTQCTVFRCRHRCPHRASQRPASSCSRCKGAQARLRTLAPTSPAPTRGGRNPRRAPSGCRRCTRRCGPSAGSSPRRGPVGRSSGVCVCRGGGQLIGRNCHRNSYTVTHHGYCVGSSHHWGAEGRDRPVRQPGIIRLDLDKRDLVVDERPPAEHGRVDPDPRRPDKSISKACVLD